MLCQALPKAPAFLEREHIERPPPVEAVILGVGFTGDPRNAVAFWKNDVLSPVMSAETWLAVEATTPSLSCCAIPLLPRVGT
jgi:hypothetical protein